MRRFGRHCCAAIFSLACLASTTAAVLAQISPVTVTPSNDDAGASTVYEISFTAGSAIPANGSITIAFPTGFDVSGVIVANNVSGLTGGYSSVGAGGTQTVTLVRDNTGTAYSGPATLRIAVVVNHNTVGGYSLSVAATGNPAGNGSFSISAAPLDRFTMSAISSPQTAGANFSFTVSAFDAFNNAVSFSGTLSLSDNTGTLTPSSVAMGGTTVTVNNANITKAQSGVQITASGGGKSVTSNSFTVNAGSLSYVKVVEGPSGDGSELGTKSLTTDNTLTVHAAGYDVSGNYVGDQTVTWSVSGGIGVLSSGSGTSTTLDPRTPGSGSITADHATATDDATGMISVSVGAAYRVKVLSGASGNTAEVTTAGLTTGGTLVVHAGSFDADGNYIADVSVTWSVSGGIGTLTPGSGVSTTLTATTVGSGVITGDHATLIDDATGAITVSSGSLSYVKIVEGPSGNGAELTTKSLTADQSLTVHTAGYDASNNYLGDFSVTWGSTGTLAPVVSGSGTSVTFSPTTAPASGTITADHATATDDATGTISVSVGAAYRVKVLSGASGNTSEVTTAGLTTGGTLVVHAGSFDADGNYIADVSVTWSVSGGIGTLNNPTGITTTLTATTPGTGQINADHATLLGDATGAITVSSGSLSYVKIVEGPSGNGAELTTKSLTADQSLTVHAAGYDASNNYLGDFSVTWGSTGTLAPVVSGSGTSVTFSPTTAPASGTITATHATAMGDATGTISVTVGAAYRVKVLNGLSGATTEVTTGALMPGGTLPVHAGSFDADGNYIADVSVTWSVSGGIGTIPAGPSPSATFTATTVGTGVITAEHTTLIGDATGTISVLPGAVASITLRTASGNGGTAFGTFSMSSDDSVTIYAAGYDAGPNYLGDVSVAWSGTGSLAPVSGSGSSFTFRPTTAPASGTIVGTYPPGISDATGTITVNTGKPTGTFTLTANPAGMPADNASESTLTSSALRDGDNNLVRSGKKFTITISGLNDLTIVTADADPGLSGHQVATDVNSVLTFRIRAGVTGGSAIVTAISVDNGLCSGNTTLTLGSLSVLSITAPATVSQLQQDVVVSMAVKNLGTAQITELAGALFFTVGGADRNGQYNVTASPANPTSIAGNATQTLAYFVDINSAPAGETVTIDGSVSGKVSGTLVSDVGADTPDTWLVQTAATLTVQSVSTTPTTVSRGQAGILVNVTVRNNFGVTTAATATVDSVRLLLKSGATNVTSQYTISANAGNPTTIASGAEAPFAFTVDVSAGATLGNITIDARAYGRDANSLTAISDMDGAATTDSWTVIDAAAFSIVSLTPSQSSVTVGMTKPWTVRMRLQNGSSSSIAVDLASNKTYIRLAVGNDTTGWVRTQPTQFDEGGNTLNPGQARHLTFTITQTGTKPGTATISGFVAGTDLRTGLPVTDTTVDGGSGEVAVQTRASPQVNTVVASQATVTAGQTQDWTVTATIFNNGQSAIQYSRAQTSIVIANGIGYAYLKPNTFADGDSVVDDFETKNLSFTVDVTGTQVGENLPMSVVFKGVELNTGLVRTSSAGSGLITVQTPAQLQISSTTATTINGSYVNVGQSFTINVQVSNLGQEIVDSLRVRLISSGGSIIQPPNDQLVTNLTNLSPRAVAFGVSAGAATPVERFTASIISSTTHNTHQAAPISPPIDESEDLTVQNPAVMQVQVATSVAVVEAGQTDPFWKIYAIVANAGGAPLQIDPPRVSNISLKMQGVQQSDYALSAPTSLLHGGLTLLGGESDTLVYTVTRTGEVGGILDITATISGIDKNDNTVRTSMGSGSINVASSAAVRLTDVHPLVFRTNLAGVGFVNTSQPFQISITVENPSLEAVRDVVVSLGSDGLSTVLQSSRTINFVEAGSSASLNFGLIAAPGETVTGEILTARITAAIAAASGSPARIRTPNDSTGIVIIERPATLVMAGATDDPDNILTTAQVFQVRGKVENWGQAPYDSSGAMQLTVPEGYVLVGPDSLTRNFKEGETAIWTVRAPLVVSGPDTFILAIVNVPKDRNTDNQALVNEDSALVIVQSLFSDLAVTKLFVSSPAGGADSVISTDQFFNVTANIAKSSNLVSGTATLAIPQGYVFRLGPQDAVRNTIAETMTWLLQAPPDEHSTPQSIALTVEGRDQQNQTIVADRTLPVRTVRKASLALNAFISNPPGARGGQLSVDQVFYIRAELRNSGTARTVGPARARINFGATGVSSQDSSVQDIPVDGFFEWKVQAPAVETGAASMVVALERPYPLDENTGLEASTPQPSKSFPVVTGDQGFVSITDFRISYPSGAQDSIVSTGQNFQVTAALVWSNAVDLQARLYLPPDFRTETPIKVPTTSQLTWDVTAPAAAADSQALSVVFTAVDSRNPNLAVADTSNALVMRVVRRANLRMWAEITSPQSAQDGTVSVGQEFTVEATLVNTGQARVIGSDSIHISLPGGYTTQEAAIKATVENKVQWVVGARNSRSLSLNERIAFELLVPPQDENTNDDAQVSLSVVELPIFTESKRLVVNTLPRRNPNSVARGDQRVSMMGLELVNQSDAGSSNIILRRLRLSVRDRSGALVSPSSVLSGMHVQRYGKSAVIFAALADIPAANPITLFFNVRADTVQAAMLDSLEVTADLSSHASSTSFYVSLEDSADVDAIDQDSGQRVEIMDSQGRTGQALEVRSNFSAVVDADYQKAFGNYPNPFGRPERPATRFVYYLPAASAIEFRIYSLLGELVWQKTFRATETAAAAGLHDGDIVWNGVNGDGERVLNGVYVAVLKSDSGTVTTKVAVVK